MSFQLDVMLLFSGFADAVVDAADGRVADYSVVYSHPFFSPKRKGAFVCCLAVFVTAVVGVLSHGPSPCDKTKIRGLEGEKSQPISGY